MAADLAALRNYVTAKDSEEHARLPAHVVSLNITHSNLAQTHMEIRFDRSSSVAEVKQRLHQHCGTPQQYQRLILRSGGTDYAFLDDDTRMLGYYSPEHGMELHVIDLDPHSLSKGGGLEDTSMIEKYRMTEEAYDKREGTLRDWVRKKKAANPDWMPEWEQKSGPRTVDPIDLSEECMKGLELGQRCEVDPGGRRGVLEYLGKVDGLADGYWAGVRFDEPVGKGDGTVKGQRIFDCEARYGGFIRPRNVRCGDFPERDLLEDSDEDEL
uniref:CAP-Gly domain-containing protein n=1 Tax=Pinguiococcus pyrenoidosus TaxID=172671 RepID=A0A7R9UBU7_9STRA